MTKEAPRHPVTISMFDNRIHPGEVRIMAHFFGPMGRDYFYNKFRSEVDANVGEQGTLQYLDAYFFRQIKESYPYLTHGQEVQFYRSQLNRANKVVKYLISQLDLPEGKFGLRNEVEVFPDSPSDRIKRAADPGSSSILRYEVSRQLVLAYLAAPLDERATVEKLETRLSNFQDFLDRNLYDGKTAETHRLTIFSQHDNRTNSVVDYTIGKNRLRRRDSTHIKKNDYEARNTKIGIEVATNIRHKGENESIIKAIMKAIINHKPINITESVQDSIGMKFAVAGGKEERDRFKAQFEEIVQDYKDFDRLVEDDAPNNDRGQHKSAFKRRTQIYLKGLSVPIEIIYYSMPEYLDSEYEIGINNNGRAHKLYEMRRLGQAALIMFIQDMYGADIVPFIDRKLTSIADELKFKDMVDEDDKVL